MQFFLLELIFSQLSALFLTVHVFYSTFSSIFDNFSGTYLTKMNKKRIFLFLSGGFLGLIIILVATWFLLNNQYISNIPEITGTSSFSEPLKNQIAAAVKKAKRNPSAYNLGELGMVYHSSANYTQAEQCYALAIKRSETDWVWNYYNGYLNMEMGDSEGAIENFKQVIQKNPEIKLSWYYMGGEYKNMGNDQMAESTYLEIANEVNTNLKTNSTTRRDYFPLSAYAGFEMARIYFNTGRQDLAKSKLEEIIRKNYLFGPAYRLLGSVYHSKGDKELGEKYTIRANDFIAFTPPVDTLIDKLVLMSRSELFLLKRIDEAIRTIHSDWALQMVEHGLIYLPDNNYMISKAIFTYLWKRMDEKAIALVDKHIGLFNDNFAELKSTGMLFFKKGLHAQSVKYWTRALEIKPGDIEILENLAKSLWGVNQKQKSLDILYQLIENNPDKPDIVAESTYILLQFGDKEKALSTLKNLKSRFPSNPKVLKIMAEIAENEGDNNKAVSLYESSFKGDPEDLQVIRNLGNLLRKQEKWKQYIGHFQKALKFHPNDPELLGRLGTFLIECQDTTLRNYQEGKVYCERAFTYYDCPPHILIPSGSHLAYAYAMLGDKQRAIVTISQTINIARRLNISKDEQVKLEKLYRTFQSM